MNPDRYSPAIKQLRSKCCHAFLKDVLEKNIIKKIEP
jgi:hypothetical protein